MENHSPAEFDPELAALIRRKVPRLVGHHGFTSSDVQDLEQELYLQTFEAMKRYDPTRGSREAYRERIVHSKILTIIEGNSAQKREWRRHRHLGDSDAAVADHRTSQDSDAATELREALRGLDPELQGWATVFANFKEAEIIQLTGLTRGQVREKRRRMAGEITRLGLAPKKSNLNNQTVRESGR